MKEERASSDKVDISSVASDDFFKLLGSDQADYLEPLSVDGDIKELSDRFWSLKTLQGIDSRAIVMISERHDMPRLNEAQDIVSRFAKQTSLTPRLFSEAAYNHVSEYGIVGTTDPAVTDVSFPLSLVRASLLMSRGMAALNNPGLQSRNSLLEETIFIAQCHRSSLGGSVNEITLADTKEALVLNFIHTVQKNADRYQLKVEQIEAIVHESLTQERLEVVRPLADLCIRLLGAIEEGQVERLNELSRRATSFFEEPDLVLRFRDVQALRDRLASDLIYASEIDSQLTDKVQRIRELLMAYYIADESFDIAVFNCGRNHSMSQELQRYLVKRGIHVIEQR